jgi:hypothetical protein
MMKTVEIQSNAQHGGKKPYQAPTLVRYGDVRTLTQTGSTGGSESNEISMSDMPCINVFKSHSSCIVA